MSFLFEPLLKGTRERYGQLLMQSPEEAPFDSPPRVSEPVFEPPPAAPLPPVSNHPYYPPGVEVPGYAPNEASVLVLLPALAGMLGSALLAGLLLARRRNPDLTRTEGAVFCWFLMCESAFFFLPLLIYQLLFTFEVAGCLSIRGLGCMHVVDVVRQVQQN